MEPQLEKFGTKRNFGVTDGVNTIGIQYFGGVIPRNVEEKGGRVSEIVLISS
jgi:hypothetical protein